MDYQCHIEMKAPGNALAIRFVTSVKEIPVHIGDAYAKLGAFCAEKKVELTGAPYAAYYNMDMDALDTEAGFPVASPVQGRGDIKAVTIQGGKAAITIHTGPYTAMQPAYEAILKYIAEKNEKPTSVVYEFYLNDPQTVAPADLKTQIVFMLQ